jgi:hypothetical protein
MTQVDQHLIGIHHDLMTALALDVGQEADPAAVPFVSWIVQTLALWKMHIRFLKFLEMKTQEAYFPNRFYRGGAKNSSL